MIGVLEPHQASVLNGDRGDASTHESRADNRDLVDRQRLERRHRQIGILCRINARILLQLVRREKEEDQLLRHIGHRHVAEQP